MNISIIGTGNMGSALARRLARAGHRISVTGRDADKARALAQDIGGAAGPDDRAGIVILATPYAEAVPALSGAGDLNGRVVVDISNPLTADYMGLTLGHATSAAEEIQKAYPGARVVKAFNTLFAQVLAAEPDPRDRDVQVFVAGDDAEAKAAVRELARDAGFTPVDAGGLNNARYLEPLGGLNVYFGYGAGHGTRIAPAWTGLGTDAA